MQGKLALAAEFAGSYPEQAARVLEELLPGDASTFIDNVVDKQSASLLASMLPYNAGKCIAALSADSAARYAGNIDPKIAASILRHVPASKVDEIVKLLPRRRAVQISILLSYPQSMVGAWLEPNVLTLHQDCTVAEARKRLLNEDYADFHRIYVEDSKRNLKGFVRLVRLISDDPDRALGNMLEPCMGTLRANTSLVSALSDQAWKNSDYLPVVDREQKFLGVIRFTVLRSAASGQKATTVNHSASGTFLDLAEACYLGLADVMSASLSAENNKQAMETQDV